MKLVQIRERNRVHMTPHAQCDSHLFLANIRNTVITFGGFVH